MPWHFKITFSFANETWNLWTKMCMSILKHTETDWVLPLSRCVTKGGELASPIEQWWWSGWRGSSTCSRIKAAGPSSGWRGLRQAGGRGSSENSVYVAFLKSRRSFTARANITDENTCIGTRCLERNNDLTACCKNRHMCYEFPRDTVRPRCLLPGKRIVISPQVAKHIHKA